MILRVELVLSLVTVQVVLLVVVPEGAGREACRISAIQSRATSARQDALQVGAAHEQWLARLLRKHATWGQLECVQRSISAVDCGVVAGGDKAGLEGDAWADGQH